MEPISAGLVSFVLACAMAVKICRGQYEDAYTRGAASALYLVFYLVPDLQIEVARYLARWAWVLVGGVECSSWLIVKVKEVLPKVRDYIARRRALHGPK